MKIVIGSDHRGFHVKQRLVGLVQTLGHESRDLGVASGEASVDYPDFAFDVARLVGEGSAFPRRTRSTNVSAMIWPRDRSSPAARARSASRDNTAHTATPAT